jgi:hypothetical protein
MDVDSFLLNLDSLSSVQTSDGSNCSDVASSSTSSCEVSPSRQDLVNICDHEYTAFIPGRNDTHLQELNVLSYIAGFIFLHIKKSLCQSCLSNSIIALSSAHQDNYEFIRMKAYEPDKDEAGLCVPSMHIVSVLEMAEGKFQKLYQKNLTQSNLR